MIYLGRGVHDSKSEFVYYRQKCLGAVKQTSRRDTLLILNSVGGIFVLFIF